MPAPADDCSTIDLNAAKDSPFRNIPVYDQDGTGTCYAHSAATLMNYWLVQNGAKPGDLVNPVYSAWATHYEPTLTVKQDATDGGNPFNTISELKNKGYCKNDQVESCLSSYKDAFSMSDAEFVNFIEALYESYQATLKKDHHTSLTPQEKKKAFNQVLQNNVNISDDSKCILNRSLEWSQISSLQEGPSISVLADLFKNCTPKTSLSAMPSPNYNCLPSDKSTQDKIDQALDQKSPIAISMCSAIFTDSTYRGLKAQGSDTLDRNASENIKTDCGSHSVTLSAREKISGSCKYLVRNSWGASWHPAKTQCACIEENGVYEDICKKKNPKEFVGCWYDGKDLIPNTISSTSL